MQSHFWHAHKTYKIKDTRIRPNEQGSKEKRRNNIDCVWVAKKQAHASKNLNQHLQGKDSQQQNILVIQEAYQSIYNI